MKKYLIMAVLAVAAVAATAQEKNDKMLYVIDGKIVSKAEVDALPSSDVRNINVVKGVEGVTLITTVAATSPLGEVVVVGSAEEPMKRNLENTSVIVDQSMKVVSIRSEKQKEGEPREVKTVVLSGKAKAGDPLIITVSPDGKKQAIKDMDKIESQQIKAITVLKDSSTDQYKQYGDVSNGVIIIEMQ